MPDTERKESMLAYPNRRLDIASESSHFDRGCFFLIKRLKFLGIMPIRSIDNNTRETDNGIDRARKNNTE